MFHNIHNKTLNNKDLIVTNDKQPKPTKQEKKGNYKKKTKLTLLKKQKKLKYAQIND